MLPFIHRKPLSVSATTSPQKKTNFSQPERHLHEKLSSRNFSYSLKVKGPQHSQDGECDASSISISQYDGREIGNFDQHHRKGQKISIISKGTKPSGRSVIHLAKRFPQIFPQRQTKNRQQLYVTMESEKNKLETDEDKLDNHHDDPDCIKNNTWYKGLWRELKKKAKRIVNSDVDADSSSDESVLENKRKILQIGQKRSIHTLVTRRHSDSRNKLNKHFLPNENVSFPSSEDVEVKIESWDRVTFHKTAPSVQTYMILESNIVYNNPPTPAVSILNQNRKNEEKEDTIGDEEEIEEVEEEEIDNFQENEENLATSRHLDMLTIKDPKQIEGREATTRLMHEQMLSLLSDDWINILPDEVRRNFINMSKSIHPEDSLTQFRLLDYITTTPGKTGENPVEVTFVIFLVILLTYMVERLKRKMDRNNEAKEDTVEDEEENEEVVELEKVVDNIQDIEENLATSKQLDMFTTKDQIHVENRNNEEKEDTVEDEEENEDVEVEEVASNNQFIEENLATSSQLFTITKDPIQDSMDYSFTKSLKTLFADKDLRSVACVREATRLKPDQMLSMLSNDWINILPDEMRRKFINMSRSIQLEDSLANFKLLANITTSSDKTEGEPKELKNGAAEERSRHESTNIKLYRNVMQNETCRMMTRIDMVVSEAKRLFGPERTQIFLDLLDHDLFHFGSTGGISDFVPNMAESTVRQHVISFFEHACEMMNRLMTLLLGCPDSNRLQPMQDFISLMRSVIDSSLKANAKEGQRLSSKETKGTRLIMVDSEEFARALGEEMPEDVLDRLRHGDEMIVHRFVDTRLEKTQASERRENRHIHYTFFPSDCRLFIYIPTENGSYWHHLDMQKANRLSQHGK